MEEILYNKIITKEELTKKEIQNLIEFEVEEIEGDEGRWTRNITTISKLKDKFFLTEWKRALTECQEHEYYKQPYEVKPEEKEVVIIQRKWNKI